MVKTTEQEQRDFENKCLRLRQDDPTLEHFHDGPKPSNDEICAANHILLGRSLVANSHLHILMFDYPVLDESVAHALATGIAQSKLTSLRFCGTNMAPREQPPNVWRILFTGIESLPTLQQLWFFGVTTKVLHALRDSMAALTTIRELAVSCAEGCQGGLRLSQILTRTHSLTLLYVHDENLGEIGISLLAHGLRCNLSVTTLQLHGCKIDDECLAVFLELWQPDSPIRKLFLHNNHISRRGAQLLLRAVAGHPAMREVSLLGNRNIGYDGLIMIGDELRHQTSVTKVNVCECARWMEYPNPNSREARDAQNKALHQAGRSLLEGVQQNVNIQEIDASWQHLPLDVENEIDFYANLNKMGRYLLSTDHGLASTVWCYILAKCQSKSIIRNNKESLVYFFLCAEPSLVQHQADAR